jgi:hypothetical protein
MLQRILIKILIFLKVAQTFNDIYIYIYINKINSYSKYL